MRTPQKALALTSRRRRSSAEASLRADRRGGVSDPHIPSVAALTLLVAMFAPATVSAQIYAWRDANGTLVLSDRELNTPTKIFEVPGAPSYRTTTADDRAVSAPRFDDLVLAHAQRHSLRPELVRAVIQVESGFNPMATSPKGAMGLMQLMPATARALGVRNPYDPEDNIRGGTAYLRQLLDKYDGNEQLADLGGEL